MKTLLAALALTGALTVPAHAFRAQNDLIVDGSGTEFHVQASPGQGASQSWCAAGDYVIRDLGIAPTTRIWRTSEPPRRQGQGVSFSLTPEGAASKTGLLVLGAEGASLTAAFAQQHCFRYPEQDDDDS
ncbi:hypothetical protein [Cereibacter changlensis]|uniref:hypothetical protein n=1 Tax=Cereibacter changlensis TaxID=402884 RepID=UPI004034C7F6